MDKKRILFLAMWFLPQVGGMEMSSYEIVSVLKNNGYNIQIVTADHPEAKDFDFSQDFVIRRAKGVFLKNLAEENKIKRVLNYFNYYFKYYKQVKKAIKEFAPDEIIVADEQTRNWYGFFASKIKYEPIVVASMPERKNATIKIKVVSKTLKKAKAIYCVSNSTKEKMCEAFGNEFRDKMHVLYRSIGKNFTETDINHAEVNKIKETYGLNNRFVFLSVCRLSDKKGIIDLIEAVHLLGEKVSDCKFLVCGDGPEKNTFEKKIYEYKLNDVIELCGQVNKDDIINYYDACDCFVLPSIEESFGRVYVEAGARRKASIGCRIGGVSEVIDDGETGCLIEPKDVDALSEAIVKLKNDAVFRNTLAENMYKKVLENFSAEALTVKWKNIIKQEQ